MPNASYFESASYYLIIVEVMYLEANKFERILNIKVGEYDEIKETK